MEDIMSLYFRPKDQAEDEDISWQEGLSIDTGYVCECGDGEEIVCTGVCSDEGDYRRRYLYASVTKNHETIFMYPGLPSSLSITGSARIQKD